jgi:hypothetical protein
MCQEILGLGRALLRRTLPPLACLLLAGWQLDTLDGTDSEACWKIRSSAALYLENEDMVLAASHNGKELQLVARFAT